MFFKAPTAMHSQNRTLQRHRPLELDAILPALAYDTREKLTMDPSHARIVVVVMTAIIAAIKQMWDTICNLQADGDIDGDHDQVLESFVMPFLLLQWGAASARKVPQFQTQFVKSNVNWYIKPRSSIHWWNHFVFYAREDDERWRELFRLPYQLFQEVVEFVRDDLQQKEIPESLAKVPGRVFSIEKKVGIAIMVLASRNCQYHIANASGSG
ncbi:hypothetical protein L7F22_008042 [Adiantum nelumboides]|nr:hypothetical protein [Adiantum nelumboides]